MSIITDYLPWFLGLLTVLVFVHELGHYTAARIVGVHCDAFSIGFGPELFGWTDKRGCRWRFAAIPLGGYVKMQGDADVASAGHDETAERPGGLLSASIGGRAFIFVAGPMANFLLAGILAAILYMTVGQQVTPPVIGAVSANGAAALAGLQAGDRVVAINGSGIDRFEDIRDVELMAAGRTLTLEVARDGARIDLTAIPQSLALKDRFGNLYERGDLGLRAEVPPRIGLIGSGQAAEAAGLQVGDLILAMDAVPVRDFGDLANYIRARPDQPVALQVKRDDQTLTLTVTPRPITQKTKDGETTVGRVGVTAAKHPPVRLAPPAAIGAGALFVWEKSGLILDYLWQVVAGLRPVNEIGGVLRIAQIAGDTAAISFLALVSFGMMLSLNLGLINLFPVPMLDGGHLVFLAIEWARGQRMSERAEEFGYRIGFAMVIGLMLFATWNDLMHFQVFERLKTWIG
ncbi:MAG: RIP metalloprotease RseP [Alphaproteobacteria bacterium]